jgi:hypothetical protein
VDFFSSGHPKKSSLWETVIFLNAITNIPDQGDIFPEHTIK